MISVHEMADKTPNQTTDNTTGAMQEFGAVRSARPGGGPLAGLVLLYADAFAALPAAFPLSRERMVIGREPECDLPLPVSAVSRVHAELSWTGGAWVVHDLGSRNGVLVNGRRIVKSVLEPLDEVRIGDAIFKFVDKHAELYGRYRIDGALAQGAERKSRQPSALTGGYQMDRIIAELERIAPTELSVIVSGPSGTGKEVVASELHRLSGRRGRYCAINCAAIPAQLIESELFGYKRGAFSGADRDKPGIVRAADQGTLLLDEIGDMPLEAQVKLLRVLQSKEVFPLGATVPERVDVRVVCATHRDLARLQSDGRFREDLFARLNEYSLDLPPLYERKEDVYLLARAFLERYGKPAVGLSFPFMTGLLHYDFPYNVRELEACIKRAVALVDGKELTPDLLPEAVQECMTDYGRSATPAGARPAGDAAGSSDAQPPSDAELRMLLSRHQGNVAAVGRELGKARMQVHRWMRRYGIDIADYRS